MHDVLAACTLTVRKLVAWQIFTDSCWRLFSTVSTQQSVIERVMRIHGGGCKSTGPADSWYGSRTIGYDKGFCRSPKYRLAVERNLTEERNKTWWLARAAQYVWQLTESARLLWRVSYDDGGRLIPSREMIFGASENDSRKPQVCWRKLMPYVCVTCLYVHWNQWMLRTE